MIQDFSTRLSGLSPKKRALLRLALEKQGATFNAFPLSFAQQRVWFMEQLTPGTAAYTIPGAFRLTGRLDATQLTRSINAIVQRHASLRTTFLTIDGQAIQTIAPALTIQVPLIDLQELPAQQREAAAQRLATAEAEHVFDLARGPLIRASIVRLAQDEHILLINIHHIIFDLWSMGVFMAELAQLYTSLTTGDDQALPMPPLQYVDFAGWQRQWVEEQVLNHDLPYWQQQLADLPPSLDLPTDRPRPASQSFRGASQPLRIDRVLAAELTALSQREGVTLFMTLLAAFNVLLYRYTGQRDLVVGSPIANRTRAEFTGLIGYFLNTLALRTDLAGNPSFREVVGRVREVALEAFAHSDLPFEILVEKLQPEHDGSRSPLFQALFILQPAQAVDQPIPGVTIAPLPLETTWSMVDLGLWISETGDGLTGSFSYSTDLFDAATIARMAEHFQVLLASLVADPGRRILDVPILTDGEARQLCQWNRTEAVYPQDASFAALFEAQVERSPDAIAVRWQDQQLSYAELNRQANQLAALLIERGVGRDVIVGLLAERSINFLVAVLAVFKAGGAYLPLDPQHPEQRWVQILSQSRTSLVLAASAFLPALSQAAAQLDAAPALLSIEDALADRREVENPSARSTAADVAYVIYTSGSTGLPKGAVVEQRGMINHLYAKLADLALTEQDHIAQTASQCFDISVWQFLAALLVGGTVQIFPDAVSHDPTGLLGQVAEHGITILETVPSLLRVMLEDSTQQRAGNPRLAALRWLIPTGEALPPDLARLWLDRYPHVPLINAYGPTECSDDVTHHRIDQAPGVDLLHMPIGRAVANTQIYVLNTRLQPAPVGVRGELYVGGHGVGRGYLNDPQRTAEVFIPDTFSGEIGARLYKTGDLGRYLPDGTIEFLGRVDYQVKLRGFRIELREIETVLEQHPAVQTAVVIDRESSLVAYVVENKEQTNQEQRSKQPEEQTSDQGEDCSLFSVLCSPQELRSFLKDRLPAYMVPSAFVVLESLPLTANGKIDRRALPSPLASQTEQKSTVAPRDEIERNLVQIWEQLLGVQPIGIGDDFFELGGHSILAVRLMAQIEQAYGVELQLATFFEGSTIADLAALLREQTQPAAFSTIVPIQTHGTQRPFFCVHPGGGHVMSYQGLAQQLGPDQPFYGIQAVGIDGSQPPLTTFEAMAERYVQDLRSIQPEGPYTIGGWCTGGRIAYVMARQLHSQGQEVALLALFDAPPAVEGLPSGEVLADDTSLLASMSPAFAPFAPQVAHLEGEQRLAQFVDLLKAAGALPPDVALAQIRNILTVFRANIQAEHIHQRQPYAGHVTLFSASERPAEGTPDLGWAALAADGVDVITVPGDHLSIIEDAANVAVLAQRLRAELSRAAIEEEVRA